jgi:hypothetical protein
MWCFEKQLQGGAKSHEIPRIYLKSTRVIPISDAAYNFSINQQVGNRGYYDC